MVLLQVIQTPAVLEYNVQILRAPFLAATPISQSQLLFFGAIYTDRSFFPTLEIH